MKKRLLLLTSALIPFLGMDVYASWQLANSQDAMPNDPFFQASIVSHKDSSANTFSHKKSPGSYATLGQPAPVYAMRIRGSLKRNLERIMGRYHWKVIWKAPYDYKFDGKVAGATLPSTVEKLLEPFPLRAEMYMANKTIAVYPKA